MSKQLPTVGEIQIMAQSVLERLRSGEIPVGQAKAEIAAINAVNAGTALRMEWARISGRIENGSDVLPDLKLDPNATPGALKPGMPAARLVLNPAAKSGGEAQKKSTAKRAKAA